MTDKCKDCKKRFPGCSSYCPDWVIDTAFENVKKQEQFETQQIKYGLMVEHDRAVRKRIKRNGNFKRGYCDE